MNLLTTQCYPEDHHFGNIQREASKICDLLCYSVVTVGAVYCSSICPRTQYRNPEDGSLSSIENGLCPLKYQPCIILQPRKVADCLMYQDLYVTALVI
jgi:hypothetical protein